MSDSPLDRACDIFADGFFDNPVMAWVFEDPATRPDGIRGYVESFVSAYSDHGILEIDDGGEGAALWADPDTPPLDGERAADLVAVIQKHNGERTGLVLGTLGQIRQPEERHWYLNVLAARRGTRGRGIGARLLEPHLERADREGVPVYLESSNPRNLTFYDRYGFEHLGEPLDLPGAGPMLQPMWRPVGAKA